MIDYTEKRLEELRNMSTEEVAACKIRPSTPPRVKAVILQAREKMHGKGSSNSKQSKKASPKNLKDGDVLIMHKGNKLTQKIISAWTRSPYTHAALYSKGKVYDSLSPSSGKKYSGGNINTLKEFTERDKGHTYDVFRPKERKTAREAARNIERVTQETKGYSYGNLVQAGLRDRFGFGITTNYDRNYKICSELVYDAFNGLIGSDASSSVTPARLSRNKYLEKVDTLRLSIEELFR
ncbi:MAG: hypothetical protein LBI05_02420 [Planctomycetaceae bacterium]|jgi:hypothetical protein|nr:hypothetical protein [Planctomycetaceae bacterium]